MFNIYFKEMKKFFSLIALVGVFAACEPENLQTAFTVANATATVNETVVCVAPDFDPSEVTVTYDWSVGTGLSTKSITGNPAIEAGSVTVTAHYRGAEASTTVRFPKIFAGMGAELTATVYLPYNAGKYDLEVVWDDENAVKETHVLGLQAAAHGHGYQTPQTVTFDDEEYKVYMMQNATEFILEDSYEWEWVDGDVVSEFKVLNPDFADLAEFYYEMVEDWDYWEMETRTFEFSVGAWSLYNVINPVTAVKTPCYIVATPQEGSGMPEIGPVASFANLTMFSACGVVEMAHPDHDAHYVPHSGHYTHDGHALHGDNNNAGGGIITAE